ncbi:DivIVA domain-containing protein [Eubacteriales bacterium OttesenSCG-928-K08]|nr:DivIVA domain-containing protein [Eubacteriales bacterium OttesenSCG-928-K08]
MRADDIVRQRFTKVFRGYDVQEVDLFLDEVIRTIEELEAERNQLLTRLEVLLQELDRSDRLVQMHKDKQRDPQQPALQSGQNAKRTVRTHKRHIRAAEPMPALGQAEDYAQNNFAQPTQPELNTSTQPDQENLPPLG